MLGTEFSLDVTTHLTSVRVSHGQVAVTGRRFRGRVLGPGDGASVPSVWKAVIPRGAHDGPIRWWLGAVTIVSGRAALAAEPGEPGWQGVRAIFAGCQPESGDQLTADVHATRPLRLAVQIRAPGDERFYQATRMVPGGGAWTRIDVPLADLRDTLDATRGLAADAGIEGVLFYLDEPGADAFAIGALAITGR